MVLGQRLDSAWKHTFITVVACLVGNFSMFFAPDESIYLKENLEEPVSRKKKGSPRQWLCGCGVANPDLDLSLPDSGKLRSQVRICQRGGGTQRLASNEILQRHSMNQATCVWPIQSHTPS